MEGAKKYVDNRVATESGAKAEDWSVEEDRRFKLHHMGSLCDTAHTQKEIEASRDKRIEDMKEQVKQNPSMARHGETHALENWTIEDTQAN